MHVRVLAAAVATLVVGVSAVCPNSICADSGINQFKVPISTSLADQCPGNIGLATDCWKRHASVDDGCDPEVLLPAGTNINFFNQQYTSFFACPNGLISFDGGVSAYTPIEFPIAEQPAICAYWADFDLRMCDELTGDGCAYYRVYVGEDVVNDEVRNLLGDTNFGTNPAGLVTAIVTWNNVGYFSQKIDKLNSVQLIVTSDGGSTYAFFYYQRLEWTTGDASRGVNGLSVDALGNAIPGATAAQCGFDKGNGADFLSDPLSFSPAVLEYTDQWRKIFSISSQIICVQGYVREGNDCVELKCKGGPLEGATAAFSPEEYAAVETVNTGTTAACLAAPVNPGEAVVEVCCTPEKRNAGECSNGVRDCYCALGCAKPTQQAVLKDAAIESEYIVQCQGGQFSFNDASFTCQGVGLNIQADPLITVSEDPSLFGTVTVTLKSPPLETISVGFKVTSTAGTPTASLCYEQTADSLQGGVFECEKTVAAHVAGGNCVGVQSSTSCEDGYYLVSFTAANYQVAQPVHIVGIDDTVVAAAGETPWTLEVKTFVLDTGVVVGGDRYGDIAMCTGQAGDLSNCVPAMPGKTLDNEGASLRTRVLISEDDRLSTTEKGVTEIFSVVFSKPPAAHTEVRCFSTNMAEGRLLKPGLKPGQDSTFSGTTSRTTPAGVEQEGVYFILDPVQFAATVTGTQTAFTQPFTLRGVADDKVDGDITYSVECSVVGGESVSSNPAVSLICSAADEEQAATNNTCYGTQTFEPFSIANEDENSLGIFVDFSVSNNYKICGGDVGTTFTDCPLASEPTTCGFLSVPPSNGCAQLQTDEDETQVDRFAVRLYSQPIAGDVTVTVLENQYGKANNEVVFTEMNWNTYQFIEIVGKDNSDALRDTTHTMELYVSQSSEGSDIEVFGQVQASGYRTCAEPDATCFLSAASSTAVGTSNAGVFTFDRSTVKFDVFLKDNETYLTQGEITGLIAGLIGLVLLIIVIIIVVLLLMWKREKDIKDDREKKIEEQAHRAEGAQKIDIDWEIEDENVDDLQQKLLDVNKKLKSEVERLKAENTSLSNSASEEPLILAPSENPSELVNQIKQLKAANDRLSAGDMNRVGRKKRTKTAKTGFGQENA